MENEKHIRTTETEELEIQATEPSYPILKAQELGNIEDLKDLRGQLPYETVKYFRPEELVIDIHTPEVTWPDRRFTPVEIIMKATNAGSIEEIGRKGPAAASVNVNEHSLTRTRYPDEHARDVLEAAEDVYELYPWFLDHAVASLANTQGVDNEQYQEGEPFGQEELGAQILVDQKRDDPITIKFGRLLHWKPTNYFSVDATLHHINAFFRLQQSDHSYAIRRNYQPKDGSGVESAVNLSFERDVTWAENKLEQFDGLFAYKNVVMGGGMRNQGWRDSANAMVHKNGDWASDQVGVAPIEVQGFGFDALMNAGRIYRSDLYHNPKKAEQLEDMARQLQKKVLEDGFVSTADGGYFASGFDWGPRRELRQLAVATSAAGRLLGTEILKINHPDIEEKVRLTITKLFSPEMLTRWGIRTLASNETAYGPLFYHTGASWMHDTNKIAAGLSNHGYHGLDRIIGSMTRNQYAHTGMPYEHISGYDSEVPIIPSKDIYVYNRKYDETYLATRIPHGQLWAATSEEGKQHRYLVLPSHAIDPQKFKFEKQIWQQLPDHIKAIATYYEPELALALSH